MGAMGVLRLVKRRWRQWQFRAYMRWLTDSDDVLPALISEGKTAVMCGSSIICTDCGQIMPVTDEGNWPMWLARHDCEW